MNGEKKKNYNQAVFARDDRRRMMSIPVIISNTETISAWVGW